MQDNVTLRGFDGVGSANKLSSPVQEVIDAFHSAFEKEWTKRSSKMQITKPVVIEGNFVRIDEGSRWMRYVLTLFAGHAVVEVDGNATLDGQQIAELHYVEKSAAGLFGGNSRDLLKLCAGGAARKIAKNVIQEVKARGPQ